ncbi:MAG: DUF6159 family protein [Candidatus Pacearchaeota archaeon]
MGVLSNSWEITKSTFNVMKKDKEIFIYPILSILISIIFIITVVLISLPIGRVLKEEMQIKPMIFTLIFILYFGIAFIGTFFSACVVYTAGNRFNGKNVGLRESIAFASKRIDKVALWAIISATVGIILMTVENFNKRSRGLSKFLVKIISSTLDMAWSISTIFVVQGIIYKNLGPLASIKESLATLKKTWGESLVRIASFEIVKWIFLLIGGIVLIILMIISFVINLWFGLIMFTVLINYLVGVFIFFNIAKQVFNTALYHYANTGKIPRGYNEEQIKRAFKSEKNLMKFE